MSSNVRGGRAGSPTAAAEAALRAGQRAIALVEADSEDTYLGNGERQLAIERLLIRFGEALKDIPDLVLEEIDPVASWSGPKGFRDLASHWYEEGLDHRLIWRVLRHDLPPMLSAIETWLSAQGLQAR